MAKNITLIVLIFTSTFHLFASDYQSLYPITYNGQTCMMPMPIKVPNEGLSYHYLFSAMMLTNLSNDLKLSKNRDWYAHLLGDENNEHQDVLIENRITKDFPKIDPMNLVAPQMHMTMGQGRVMGFFSEGETPGENFQVSEVSTLCKKWRYKYDYNRQYLCGAIVLDFNYLIDGLFDHYFYENEILDEIQTRALLAYYSILKSIVSAHKWHVGVMFKIINLPDNMLRLKIGGKTIKLGEFENLNELITTWDIKSGRLKAIERYLYSKKQLSPKCPKLF